VGTLEEVAAPDSNLKYRLSSRSCTLPILKCHCSSDVGWGLQRNLKVNATTLLTVCSNSFIL
jgi:hypothetical protein